MTIFVVCVRIFVKLKPIKPRRREMKIALIAHDKKKEEIHP